MLKKSLLYFAAFIGIALSGYFFLQPESAQNEVDWGRGPSADSAGLRKYVDIDNDIVDLQWELFGTPEWSGGVPGPTDYMTLIVTGKVRDGKTASVSGAGDDSVYIPINSNRSWLRQEQSAIVNSLIEKTALPPAVRCVGRYFNSSSGKNGFAGLDCRRRDEVVFMVPLVS